MMRKLMLFTLPALLLVGCSKLNAPQIVEATYGLNCKSAVVAAPFKNTVAAGNATKAVQASCDKSSKDGTCNYKVELETIGDPASGCEKDFTVSWKCGNEVKSAKIAAEAYQKTVTIGCAAAK